MKTIRSVFLFLITLAAVVLLVELYLQSAEIELAYHTLDPKLGKRILPNKNIVMLDEGFYLGRSNKYGYLGPAYPPEKEKNTFRIALVGDSYTEGFQLFEKYHFRSILEHSLQKYTDRKVEVLNFGNGNFNFSDMYICYENFTKDFHPDMVLFTLKNNDFEPTKGQVPSPKLYIEEDSLKIDYGFTERGKFKFYNSISFLAENSSLFKMLLNYYRFLMNGKAPQIILDKFYTGFESKDFVRDYTYNARQEIPFTDEIKKAIEELSKEKPTVYFVHQMGFPPNSEQYIRDQGIKTINLNDTLELMRQVGIKTHYWKATNRYNHWNHDAQEAVGRYLAKKLKSELPRGTYVARQKN